MRSPWTARAAVAGVLVLPFLALPAVPADTGHAPGPPRAAPVDDAARLVDLVTRVRDAHASRSQAPTSLAWPAPGRITSPFGDHRNHPGIDIDGETGDPVAAAGAGVVTQAGPGPTGFGGYGTIVAIDHGAGIFTVYAHLSKVTVAVGQRVDAGAVVGAIGTTGISSGSHLHFEVRLLGKPVDPMPFLPPR